MQTHQCHSHNKLIQIKNTAIYFATTTQHISSKGPSVYDVYKKVRFLTPLPCPNVLLVIYITNLYHRKISTF